MSNKTYNIKHPRRTQVTTSASIHHARSHQGDFFPVHLSALYLITIVNRLKKAASFGLGEELCPAALNLIVTKHDNIGNVLFGKLGGKNRQLKKKYIF